MVIEDENITLDQFIEKYFMHKGFLAVGALLGGVAVALGAFGAHGLKTIVPPETVSTFQTGVQYQMYHALALVAVAIIFEKISQQACQLGRNIHFVLASLLFSGSLYVLTFIKATGKVGLEGIGIITPVGGNLLYPGLGAVFFGRGEVRPTMT
jgi:uncharacterized membrane protein YgdD (TMEM256/DUF423 family)